MRVKWTALGVVLYLVFALLGGGAEVSHMRDPAEAQGRVDDLAARLVGGSVIRVQILQIPARVLTRTRITPEMLQRQFHYELTIRDIRGGVYERKLAALAKATTVKPRAEMPDLRWGVIFYDAGEKPVVAFYFDKTGNYGAVDDVPVSFGGDLFDWLKGSFSDCFR